jgi:AbrB family looped-hinge helix DNA binding protein
MFMNEVFRAKLNNEGRLVIPAVCRKQVGLQPGQQVLLKVTPDGLLVYTPEQSLKQLQNWLSSAVPSGVSVVDELIAERRAEVAKEANE